MTERVVALSIGIVLESLYSGYQWDRGVVSSVQRLNEWYILGVIPCSWPKTRFLIYRINLGFYRTNLVFYRNYMKTAILQENEYMKIINLLY